MAQDVFEYVPPHSLEAEMSTLGSMLLSEQAGADLVEYLSDDDFYRPAHREIFKAMKHIVATRGKAA
jgi:replicative DNA helicase